MQRARRGHATTEVHSFNAVNVLLLLLLKTCQRTRPLVSGLRHTQNKKRRSWGCAALPCTAAAASAGESSHCRSLLFRLPTCSARSITEARMRSTSSSAFLSCRALLLSTAIAQVRSSSRACCTLPCAAAAIAVDQDVAAATNAAKLVTAAVCYWLSGRPDAHVRSFTGARILSTSSSAFFSCRALLLSTASAPSACSTAETLVRTTSLLHMPTSVVDMLGFLQQQWAFVAAVQGQQAQP